MQQLKKPGWGKSREEDKIGRMFVETAQEKGHAPSEKCLTGIILIFYVIFGLGILGAGTAIFLSPSCHI